MKWEIWVILLRFAFVACHKANSRLKPENGEQKVEHDVQSP